MPDQLSSDLASLKIDRSVPARSLPWAWLVGIVLLAGLGVCFYLFGLPVLQARVLTTEVRQTEVTSELPGQSSVELTSSGYVQPQLVSRVAPKIPGRVAQVLVREGDRVT